MRLIFAQRLVTSCSRHLSFSPSVSPFRPPSSGAIIGAVSIAERDLVDRVVLRDEITNRRFFAKLATWTGGNISLFRSNLRIDEIAAARYGKRVQATNNGRQFTVLPYALADFIVHGITRGATPVYSKDAAMVIEFLDLREGCKVLEAGTGSAALSLYLSRAVGSSGRVVTFENREDAQKLAMKNVALWRWLSGERENFNTLTEIDGLHPEMIQVLAREGGGRDSNSSSSSSTGNGSNSSNLSCPVAEEKKFECGEEKVGGGKDSIGYEASPVGDQLPSRLCYQLGNIIFVQKDLRELDVFVAGEKRTSSGSSCSNSNGNCCDVDASMNENILKPNEISSSNCDNSISGGANKDSRQKKNFFDEDAKFDAVVLDMMEPWNCLESALACLKQGSRIAVLVPSITQVVSILQAAQERQLPLRLLKVVEGTHREWYVLPPVARPSFSQMNHSMFVMLGVKVEPGGPIIAASLNKRRKTQAAVEEEDCVEDVEIAGDVETESSQ